MKFFSKKTYILKARRPDGTWEILGEFNQKVSWAEIKEDLNQYIEEGYDYFQLYECNEEGRNCKKLWSKKMWKKKKEPTTDEIVKRLEEYEKLRELVREKLGIKDMNPEDIVATFIYYKTLAEQLLEAFGIPKDKIQEILKGKTPVSTRGDLQELIEFIKTLRSLTMPFPPMPQMMPYQYPQMMPYPMLPYPMSYPMPQPQPQQPQPQQQLIQQPIQPIQNEEIEKLANEISEKALKKTSEFLAPPCAKGKCEEE